MQLFFMLAMLFNLAGLIGGIWLLFYGEWTVVLAGLISGFISPFSLSLLIAPSIAFVMPAMKQVEKGNNNAALVLGMASLVWTYLVLASWCVAVYYLAYSFSLETRVSDYVPCMLLAFGVAMSPLKKLAGADAMVVNNHALTSTFFFWVASIIVFFMGFNGLDLVELIWVYGVTVVLLVVFMGFVMKCQIPTDMEQ